MTSQRLVDDFARWLYVRDLVPTVDPQLGTRTLRIPDSYMNEAAVFLAGGLGQRLQHGEPPDERPHSRACGYRAHAHGSGCSSNCPTCHGREER